MAGGLPAVMARGVPGPAAIPAAAMAGAEVAAAEVVRRVQPTDASERRRKGVVDYARRIVGTALGCEVRSWSVSLLSYLCMKNQCMTLGKNPNKVTCAKACTEGCTQVGEQGQPKDDDFCGF